MGNKGAGGVSGSGGRVSGDGSGGVGRCLARTSQPNLRILLSHAAFSPVPGQSQAISRTTLIVSRLRGISSLRLFDDRITAHYCGFTGADDYYARAAASNVVERIAVPALILHAANDPFIRVRQETRQRMAKNPNITYIETEDGGHCAFLGKRNGKPGDDGRWAEREVVEFARSVP